MLFVCVCTALGKLSSQHTFFLSVSDLQLIMHGSGDSGSVFGAFWLFKMHCSSYSTTSENTPHQRGQRGQKLWNDGLITKEQGGRCVRHDKK